MKTRHFAISLMLAGAMMASTPASAQLKNFLNKAKAAVEKVDKAVEQKAAVPASGKNYYVNAATGSNRNDGLSKETAVKDLQKAIDLAEEGGVINIV